MSVRPCVSSKRLEVVILLQQGVRSIVGGEGNVEQGAASVNCAVSICEVTDKPEQVSHNNDALFHTPKVSLLPFIFYSTSNNNTEKKWQQQ